MIALCAELARQQVIQIIANSCNSRMAQGFPPLTLGRLKNRFTGAQARAHLKFISELFEGHTDESFIFIDEEGYIAVTTQSEILPSRVTI
jgi:hypothetical protein